MVLNNAQKIYIGSREVSKVVARNLDVFTAVAPAPSFPTQNLLAFWKLADLTDSSGNGNNLVNTNNVQFVAGKIGNCAEFNGSNRLEKSSGFSLITNNQDFTVSAWLYITAYGSWFISILHISGGGCNVGINPSGFTNFDTGTQPVLVGPPAPLNEWIHCVGAVRSGTAELWVNGVLEETGAWPGAINLTYPVIGTGGNSGKLDALGVWQRALTEEEIQTLYNNGNGLEP